MAPPLTEEHQRVVALNERLLTTLGVTLSKEARILDFGCGSGRHTYEYLDAGYANVAGYDRHNVTVLRTPDDIRHFIFGLDAGAGYMPFDDDTFDFVFSTSVMEHVLNKERVFREIYRVLKPGGITLHNFPSRWRPIEPHIRVPLGGAIRSHTWFRIWALAGVRNPHQRGKSAATVVEGNLRYAQAGLSYQNNRTLDRLLDDIYDDVSSIEAAFLQHSAGRSARAYRYLRWMPFVALLFRTFHTRVVVGWKAPD